MKLAWGRAFGACVGLSLGLLGASGAAQSPQAATFVPQESVLIVPTQLVEVDPLVARFTERQMQRTAGALGYTVMPAPQTAAQMDALGVQASPTTQDLEALARRAHVPHALFARASARGGQYVVRIDVVSIDRASNRAVPGWAQGSSGTEGFERMVDGLVRELMPPNPRRVQGPPAAVASPAPVAVPVPVAAPQPAPPTSTAAAPATQIMPEAEAPALAHDWRLALQTEPAFGIADDFFYNHLLGGRIDYRFDEATSMGVYVGYANLRGRDGRVGSVLSYVQLDHRIAIEGTALAIPVRLAAGYLARNGVVLRTASGIAWAFGERVELVLDVLTPVLWVTPERRLLSLDVGLEVAWLL